MPICEECRDRYLWDIPSFNRPDNDHYATDETVDYWRRLYTREEPGFEVVLEAGVQGLIEELLEAM